MSPSDPAPTQSWPAQALGAAAAGGMLLTLTPLSATRQFTWPWVALLAVCWFAPVAIFLTTFATRASWRFPPGLLTAGLVLLALSTVVSAAVSPYAPLSLLRIWPTLAGVALFLWLHDWLGGPEAARVRRLAAGLVWSGAVITTVSLAGWIWQSGGTWSLRNDVPFGHSTYTAGAMLLILPWFLWAAGQNRGWRRAGGILLAMAGLVALSATSSRGGVLAAGTVGLIAAGLAGFRGAWSRRSKILTLLLAAGVLGLGGLTNPRLRELVRHGNWGESARESNTQRSAMLAAGAALGTQRPLTGWGPGTVPLAYPRVRGRLDGGVDNVLQLHNTPVQIWATLGAAGVGAALLLLTATGWRLAQHLRAVPTLPTATAAAASVLGYGLFALTDHQLDLPAMNALLVINLALVFRGAPAAAARPQSLRFRAGLGFAAVAVLAVPLWLTGRDLMARAAYEQALTALSQGREDASVVRLQEAAELAPADPYYRHQLAGALLRRRAAAADPAVRNQLTAEAIRQLNASLAAGCLQEFADFNLGWLDLETGEPVAAARHFLAAARAAPHRGGVYFGLGLALRTAGREEAAVRAFALEWLDDPAAAAAPVWEWPDFAPLRPRVAREADALLAEMGVTQPAASYVRELWRWWAHESSPPARGFNPETTVFAETLDRLSRQLPPPEASARYPWGRLLATWQQPGRAGWTTLLPADPGLAAALADRTARHSPPDWTGFLTSGLENDPRLLASWRAERTGYGVLALHPEGPVLTDLYVKQQNRLVGTFASTIFPPKGWMPARELLARLPASP